MTSERPAPAGLLRWLPSPTGIFVLALGGVFLAITLAKGLSDSDFFWHVTTGRLIATTGAVPTVDPFSFTWGGRPWTTHEWLSELVMYRLVSGIGVVPSLFVFGIFPGAIFGTLAFALTRRGVSLLAIALPSVLAAWVLVPYVTLRPQSISWFMMAVLIAALWGLRPERARWAWALIPFFILWANLHGLYVVGLGVVTLYLLFTLAGRTAMAPARGTMLLVAAGCFLASMATPAGPVGILYPLRYIDAGDWGLATIQEWQSPDFHEPAHLGLLALILAVAVNGGRATPGWLNVLGFGGVALALLALRNAPIAAVWAVPTLALGLEERLRARGITGRPKRPVRPSMALARRLMELAVAVVIIAAAFMIAVPRLPDPDIAVDVSHRFPQAAVTRLLELDPDARVMSEYGWGGYVLSRVYDRGGRVFVDGRNDMYDQSILEDYSAVRAADPDWEEIVDRWDVEAMIWPTEVTITRGPAESGGWCEVYRDGHEVLYLRECPAAAAP